MNTITIILIIAAFILIAVYVIIALIRDKKKLKAENEKLEKKIIDVTTNLNLMTKYIEKILEIKADEKVTADKIKEAKNDEEILTILNDIIYSNNSKLQNNKNRQQGRTSTKATKTGTPKS